LGIAPVVRTKINKFEETEVWQAAREVTRRIYRLTSETPFSKNWGLADQLTRAAVSIMANIAEGSERDTTKDFAHFLGMAAGSSAEVRSHLYIALDLGYITQDQLDDLITALESILRQLKGLQRSLLSSSSSSSSSC